MARQKQKPTVVGLPSEQISKSRKAPPKRSNRIASARAAARKIAENPTAVVVISDSESDDGKVPNTVPVVVSEGKQDEILSISHSEEEEVANTTINQAERPPSATNIKELSVTDCTQSIQAVQMQDVPVSVNDQDIYSKPMEFSQNKDSKTSKQIDVNPEEDGFDPLYSYGRVLIKPVPPACSQVTLSSDDDDNDDDFLNIGSSHRLKKKVEVSGCSCSPPKQAHGKNSETSTRHPLPPPPDFVSSVDPALSAEMMERRRKRQEILLQMALEDAKILAAVDEVPIESERNKEALISTQSSQSGDQTAVPAALETEKVKLRLKMEDGEESGYIICKNDKFEKLFNAFAKKIGAIRSKCRFVFDGENLDSDQCPEDFDMENDDMIEVSVLTT